MKVLFIDKTHPILEKKLIAAGFQCTYLQLPEEIVKTIHLYDGLVVRNKMQVDKSLIDQATQLKFIARVGAGLDEIDTDYCKEKNIVCFNSPEGNRDAVGEHTLGLLLVVFNKIAVANNEVKKGLWQREKNRGLEIKGKTIGIVGYGNMGKAFAQRLQGFGVQVIAYDKYKENFTDKYVKEVPLETIFKEADVLSLHVPLTKETYHLVNDGFINKFRKNIYLLNTARGKVVCLKDLAKNIKTEKILGAGLDVLEYEKQQFEQSYKHNSDLQYLTSNPNIVFTPHVAGWSVESKIKLASVLADKVIQHFK